MSVGERNWAAVSRLSAFATYRFKVGILSRQGWKTSRYSDRRIPPRRILWKQFGQGCGLAVDVVQCEHSVASTPTHRPQFLARRQKTLRHRLGERLA